MKHALLVSVLFCLTLVANLPAAVVGWNNNGTGDYGVDCRPPLNFDGEKGLGVRWKARLPNWSNSSPIVIQTAAGLRVFCVAEPLDYSPILLCFDGDTGKELWQRELDAVPCLPQEQQAEARALAKKCWARNRAIKTLNVEAWKLYQASKADWDARPELKRKDDGVTAEGRKKLPPELEPLLKRADEQDFLFVGIHNAWGYPSMFWTKKNFIQQYQSQLNKLGLMGSGWEMQGTWDGAAYPTPVSDGTRVWTVTMHNLYTCHDLDGKILWQVRIPAGGHGPGQGGFSTSPILVDGKLISCAGDFTRCLDAANGKILWEHPLTRKIDQNMAVPMAMTLTGQQYIIGINGDIYRLSDGKVMGILPGETHRKGVNNGPIIDGDLVINIGKVAGDSDAMNLTAHRLREQSGTVMVERVWCVEGRSPIHLSRAAWRGGRLYNGGTVVDFTTGTNVAVKLPALNPGYCGAGGMLAGGYYLSWDFYNGKFLWRDLATGLKAGEGKLPVNPSDGLPLTIKQEQAISETWRWLGAATPFVWKDRLYIRAYDFLWCLGTP